MQCPLLKGHWVYKSLWSSSQEIKEGVVDFRLFMVHSPVPRPLRLTVCDLTNLLIKTTGVAPVECWRATCALLTGPEGTLVD